MSADSAVLIFSFFDTTRPQSDVIEGLWVDVFFPLARQTTRLLTPRTAVLALRKCSNAARRVPFPGGTFCSVKFLVCLTLRHLPFWFLNQQQISEALWKMSSPPPPNKKSPGTYGGGFITVVVACSALKNIHVCCCSVAALVSCMFVDVLLRPERG